MSHHKESYSAQICMEERNQASERVDWWASVNKGRFAPHQPDVVRRHRRLHLQGHLTCWKRLENRPTGSHVSGNRHTEILANMHSQKRIHLYSSRTLATYWSAIVEGRRLDLSCSSKAKKTIQKWAVMIGQRMEQL